MTTVIVTPEQWKRQTLELTAESYHHLFRVRRLRVGDRLRIVDGRGRARTAKVEQIERHVARLALGDTQRANEPGTRVELLVAAPRPQRAGWLVEKATEVGVGAVRFFNSARSPRRYGASTLERLTRMARSAVEQCERALVPEVTAVHEWREIAELLGRLGECRVLDQAATTTSMALPSDVTSVGILVGPEGGWESAELQTLETLACRAVSLGERVLRVETAALVAAAAVLVTPSVDTL
ncbi:MAG: 16S rRNA (uracil(1498)-N(3))-methyltransferase [Acidobacteriota bacterium]|nr:16S rRNA (uracil(1498)-N(3))-methyltransferase [Acidobacteriota bacterium]